MSTLPSVSGVTDDQVGVNVKAGLPGDCDGSLEMLIAFEMSRLQLIEDENKRKMRYQDEGNISFFIRIFLS